MKRAAIIPDPPVPGIKEAFRGTGEKILEEEIDNASNEM